MRRSWESVMKRVSELEGRIPENVIVEFELVDGNSVRMTVREIQEKGEPENVKKWSFPRVVSSGNKNMKQIKELLEWIAPSVID